MTTTARLLIACGAIALGTFVIRASFLLFAHRMVELPPAVRETLRMIPPAVFAALVVPVLLRRDGRIDLLDARLFAGVLAGVVAWYTRNLLATICVGLAAVLVLQWVPFLR